MLTRYLSYTFSVAFGLCSVQAAPAVRDTASTSPIVNLGYARYQGTRLEAGVDQYLGMRYAKAPLGDLRFHAPEEPSRICSVQSAASFRPICVGINQTVTDGRAEDCLFVNVFTPSSATPDSKLPVWVYIQGGGYATNSNNNYNGTGVVRASGNAIVFVNFNYRVGALGFLASEKVRGNGALNAGLLDQRKLLEWVQTHIAKFGGDPSHVVIHGASAGGGSVSYQMSAYGGQDDHLFVGASPESPFWPTQRTVPEMEFQFDRFVSDAGCSGSPDAMACLRSLDISTIQSANVASPFPGANKSPLPLWYFLPVIDGTFVTDHMYNLFTTGKFVKLPMLVGDDTDEGTYFGANASSGAEVSNFMRNNYPKLTPDQLEQINAAYPLVAPLPRHNAYFPSAAAAYGDGTFTCPGNQLAESVAQYLSPSQVWNYRYNVIDEDNLAAGLGVPHTFETSAIFGVGNAGNAAASYSGANADIVPLVMRYWISFVLNLDPNPFRAGGAPVWEPWGSGNGKRLRIQTNDTAMEAVPEELVSKCALWKELAPTMEV